MTINEIVGTLKIAAAEVEWNYPLNYAEALEEAAKELSARRWISVKERLPEDDLPKNTDRLSIKVLVCSTSGKYGVRTLSRQRWIMNFDSKTDRVTYSPWNWSRGAKNITHWMPLPSPPEGNCL